MAALMLFVIESLSSSLRAWPDQALELTAWPAYVGHDKMTTDHSRLIRMLPMLPFGLPVYVAPLPAGSVRQARLSVSSSDL
jgi:hypothetical protein